MSDPCSAHDLGRRTFLVRTLTAVQALIGTVVATLVGIPIIGPSLRAREGDWLPAAGLDALRDDEPLAVPLRVARQDGYAQVVQRPVVYLVKAAGGEVRALDSTCTHLGCRTRFDADARQFVCPCHGGVYDAEGNVVSGPPPRPLASVPVRIVDGRVFVQL